MSGKVNGLKPSALHVLLEVVVKRAVPLKQSWSEFLLKSEQNSADLNQQRNDARDQIQDLEFENLGLIFGRSRFFEIFDDLGQLEQIQNAEAAEHTQSELVPKSEQDQKLLDLVFLGCAGFCSVFDCIGHMVGECVIPVELRDEPIFCGRLHLICWNHLDFLILSFLKLADGGSWRRLAPLGLKGHQFIEQLFV